MLYFQNPKIDSIYIKMWSNVDWNQRYMWGSDSNKISKVISDALLKK